MMTLIRNSFASWILRMKIMIRRLHQAKEQKRIAQSYLPKCLINSQAAGLLNWPVPVWDAA